MLLTRIFFMIDSVLFKAMCIHITRLNCIQTESTLHKSLMQSCVYVHTVAALKGP